MAKILIRDARPTDADAIEALRQEALSERPPLAHPEDRLIPAAAALSGPALVAEVSGRVVGVLSWFAVDDHVLGGLFLVDKRHRGGEVARALMKEHVYRVEVTGNARRAFFICEDRLAPFYEWLGFKRAGVAMERLWPVQR